MNIISKEEIEKLNKQDGYVSECTRCPFCGVALFTVKYFFSNILKKYICMECARKRGEA